MVDRLGKRVVNRINGQNCHKVDVSITSACGSAHRQSIPVATCWCGGGVRPIEIMNCPNLTALVRDELVRRLTTRTGRNRCGSIHDCALRLHCCIADAIEAISL